MPQADDPLDSNKFLASDFSGGMRRNIDPSKLAENEYPLLVNGRSRYGTITPIRNILKDDKLPIGNFQACYAQENLVIIFINGYAYLRDFSVTGSYFYELPNIFLDRNVEYIYMEAVPDSFFNFGRVPRTDNVISDINIQLNQNSISRSCYIAQDGINIPWLIFSSTNIRQAKMFSEWKLDDREYVPKGLNMLWHDSILYIVSPDRKSIYHSVTGRPLDFVIAIDEKGEKLNDTLFTEEAERMAHKVSNNLINSLFKLNVIQSEVAFGAPFLVGTKGGSFVVTPDFDNSLFGEPTFRNSPSIPTAALNNNSLTYAIGDIQLIDETGLRSFNAVEQTSIISKDLALSGTIFKLFEGITQTITAATYFDNYSFFGVNTIYGPGVLIYDNLIKSFCAIDIFQNVGLIKQFCQTNIAGIKRLFFITTDGFYEYFGSNDLAPLSFYTREYSPKEVEDAHKILRFRLTFQNVRTSGPISVTPFVDRKKGITLTKDAEQTAEPISFPQDIPFGSSTENTTENITFTPQNTKQGDKIGYLVEFNFDGELVNAQLVTEEIGSKVSPEQQAKIYKKGT